ncbi:MAG TPA: asparagine synthase-related protein [Desulfatiglandales bacterium]|nr:asparagine synthase-related protein [Desulfatiglandales bacterium]
MIVYPEKWNCIGKKITIRETEKALLGVLSRIPSNNLAFSGGLDSSLLLHCLSMIHNKVRAFTIGLSENHPDVLFSKLLIKNYQNIEHIIYIPTRMEINKEKKDIKFEGDDAVKLFYKFVSRYTNNIIAGDGLDEFMCGYYIHQSNPNEQTYYKYISKLQKEQLRPLNKKSGKVKVYLPYLDEKLIYLYSQIPISDKVDKNGRKKIIQMIAKSKLPEEIIKRRKYGFCDIFQEKKI